MCQANNKICMHLCLLEYFKVFKAILFCLETEQNNVSKLLHVPNTIIWNNVF